MREPLTDELLQRLLDAPDLSACAQSHFEKERSLSECLCLLLDEKGLKRPVVIREAGLNSTFGYQIFTGERGASRDKVLQLALAMSATLKETNRLLRAAGANELYCKTRRDAIIIFCLRHDYGLQRTDDELYRFGEETVS